MLDNKKKTFLAVETTTNNIGWNVVTEDYIKSGEYIAVALFCGLFLLFRNVFTALFYLQNKIFASFYGLFKSFHK